MLTHCTWLYTSESRTQEWCLVLCIGVKRLGTASWPFIELLSYICILLSRSNNVLYTFSFLLQESNTHISLQQHYSLHTLFIFWLI